MLRITLTLGIAFSLLAPALAQQGGGLPGSPVLPGSSSADVGTTTTPTSSARPTLKDMGLAVASYMGGLVSEDPTIEVGAWYALGNYPGFQFRFDAKRLGVEVNQSVGGDGPHRRKIRYADLIGDKVIVEFRQNAERFRGDSFHQTDVAAGYHFDSFVPMDVRFEAKLFHDTPSETGYDRYRAVLQAKPASFGNKDSLLFGALTMRVGLERASIAGHGATRVVLGERFETGVNLDGTGFAFRFHVDVEGAYGGYDEGGRSRGLTTAFGTTIVTDGWRLGYETAGSREAGLAGRKLKIRRHTLNGELSIGSGFSLDARFDLLRIQNTMTAGLQTSGTRVRSGFGIGYKWLHAGTEFGQDLDGKWRPRVTAGVKIPLGR